MSSNASAMLDATDARSDGNAADQSESVPANFVGSTSKRKTEKSFR